MTIAVAQTVENSATGGDTTIDSPSITAAAGSYFHVAVAWASTADDVSSITSSPSLTWTSEGFVADTDDGESIKHYTSSVTSATSYVVTANFSASRAFRAIAVKEITGSSGADTGISSEQYTTNPAGSTDDVTTGTTGTLSAQPALVSAFCMNSSGVGLPTNGTGFTSDGTGWGFGGSAQARWESKRVTTTTGQEATFTAPSGGADCIAVAAVFTESGGGGGGSSANVAWLTA